MTVPDFIGAILAWAMARPDIAALALLGSHARGEAQADSDVDVLILTDRAEDYLSDTSWLADFGLYSDCHLEDYGALQSLRVFYDAGAEVEFGLARPGWATLPLDPGSAEVVQGGLTSLHDPQGLLAALLPLAPTSAGSVV